jgi:hypothetical protein
MATFWSAPTTKDAYLLSWVSLLFTALAALAGILLYKVRFVSLLHSRAIRNEFKTHRLLNDFILDTTHRLQDLPCV